MVSKIPMLKKRIRMGRSLKVSVGIPGKKNLACGEGIFLSEKCSGISYKSDWNAELDSGEKEGIKAHEMLTRIACRI